MTSHTRDAPTAVRWGRAVLLAFSVALVAASIAGFYAGHILLTRPAGNLPTYFPGYVPRATMFHSRRYGQDFQTVAIPMGLFGLVLGLATVLSAIRTSHGAAGDARRARRQLGSEGRFVGFTDSGRAIVDIDGQRLVYSRRARCWRPRIRCPACEQERTSITLKVASARDLARLRTIGEWECRECQRGHRRVLLNDGS